MSDFTPNKLGFDTTGYIAEFERYLDIALDWLSFDVQSIMKNEIMANGNGSKVMRQTACAQVKELSRVINGGNVELSVGVDESSLGGFTSQVFVRTAVVLHGNVAFGPLMTKPGQLTWKKDVSYMSLSPAVNKDGTPRESRMLPKSFMQYERVNGFGADRQMLDDIMNKRINRAVKDFFSHLSQLVHNIDYSQFITGG